MRRRGEFSYMTTAMVATTNVRDMDHVPNPTKPYNMARIESDSYAYTTCAGNNVTLLSYTGYECKINVFQSDLK